ncbi:lactate utilization protein B [Nocardia cerradoensis]|uniref:Lactate utilization protein B n=1 Tax=Nocardia cerradoensis TaxID=85688 RepID=A0A231GU57_9NOCA|nr:lactate utilization protein B [Nocardia cerradoensis]NKY43728.1 lactate utilization protein [Nocardia cerradoensis]OXR40108.1 Lactate utilization protein B [Nocardia cerradoensis]
MNDVFLGVPTPPGRSPLHAPIPFPEAARTAVADAQMRRNLGAATATIRAKRGRVVDELPDWEQLRTSARDIKRYTMAHLADLLEQFEQQVIARGGVVHWAADATEANRIIGDLVAATGATEVVKVKSMLTQEIGLNDALAARQITAHETDLAELIVQLADDRPSHIVVPAIHRNRSEIREIFAAAMPGFDPAAGDDPRALAAAARTYLRQKMLTAEVAISGANFAVAETGTLAVVESEGNGRMCLTLPNTLITIVGIEKLVPTAQDLEVFLQLLPRSATGERMNPYTSLWTGVHPGDGPQNVHVVLVDNGRVRTLADEHGREVLHCIRCAACLNVCPVYERTGGHAYGSVYPGPIGAVLSPQLTGVADNPSLPFASTLCGACYDVCPVAIDIPSVLVHLRAEVTATQRVPNGQSAAMATAAWVMRSPRRFAVATRSMRIARLLGRRRGSIGPLPPPLSAWTGARDLPRPPRQTFRDWWGRR